MRDYSQVSPLFWTGNTGRKLRGNREAQSLALYLITCPSSNMIGLYYIPPALAAIEIGMSLKRVHECLQFLEAADFAVFDQQYEVVFVREMARFQIGATLSEKDKRIIWIASEVSKCTSPTLARMFYEKYRDAYHLQYAPSPAPSSKSKIPSGMRWRVFERDGHRCVYCGKTGKEARLEIDHVIPESNGGKTEDSNLVTACLDCNLGKGARDIPEGSSDAPPPPPSKPGTGTGTGERTEAGSGAGSSPPEKTLAGRPRDLAMDHFVAKHLEYTGSPYIIETGDAVQLAKLRKAHQTPNLEMPPDWETAVDNFFASPMSQYSLADLSNPKRYAVFKNSPLDEFNKPVLHAGRRNGNHGNKVDRTVEAAQRLSDRLDREAGERDERGAQRPHSGRVLPEAKEFEA